MVIVFFCIFCHERSKSMKKHFISLFFAPMVFALLGCGEHSIGGMLGEILGLSSSSYFNEDSSSSSLSSSSSSSSSRSSRSSSSSTQLVNSAEEMRLYELIMEYREGKGLPRIPISRSLTHVAQVHVKDLYEYYYSFEEQCNMHSWSDKGSWTPCCYTSDHAAASCMWNKPRELTSYTSEGYEIAYWRSSQLTPESALNGWKNSSGHNAVIINEGSWVNMEWKAIGIGIYMTYAVAWFGNKLDN